MGGEDQNIKDQVFQNQGIIDQLNADLIRKHQEIRIIQEISAEINTSMELDTILGNMLKSLDLTFGFKHSMILLLDKDKETLSVAASHGYKDKGVGAVVPVGQGVIGVVAKKKKLMRMGNIGMKMSYMRAVKSNMNDEGSSVDLPGLENLQSQVAIPLLYNDGLIGVLAVDSDQPNIFDKKDELIVEILANQAASAIVKAKAHEDLRELNESLEEKVKERTKEVRKQKVELEIKNEEITDSIRYAKRIQDSLLTAENYIKEHLPNSFVLFKPKDIVSGDFYWINQEEESILFSAVDCTGHGVPGAFVSIVAHESLQRAVHVFNLRRPNEILDKINETVTKGFELNNLKDGMDMALCRYHPKTNILEYAGAQNPVYIIRKGDGTDLTFVEDSNATVVKLEEDGFTLFEIKANKQPIGSYEYRKPFTLHTVKLEKGDAVFVFTDGYADQFGGPKEKKYKYRPFKKLLIKLSQKSPEEQKEELDGEFRRWKGSLDQIDDVCVIGVRV
ncbi:SpoIIE family protein phosphatase [bacterium AH-315-C20]|nr:SpoIIE family protein phosphatase [bacterium AH-315-C20]